MSNKKKSIFFALFLLVLSGAYALELKQEETALEMCPRDTQVFVDLVRNDGQIEQAFDLKLAGSAAEWATSIPTGFVLAPDEERTIYTYITPKSGAFPANYDLDVKVSTAVSSETARHSIIVRDCHALTLASQAEKTSCPNEDVVFGIDIENIGKFQELYALSIEGQIADKVTLSENILKLNPDEFKKVRAYLKSPEKAGEYEFSVIAKAPNALGSAKAKLIVKSCYEYSVSPEREFVEMCDQSKQTIPVKITNLGTTSNNYDLTLDGPLWASLDSKKFSLDSKEQKTLNLILTPDYSVSGNFDIKINTLAGKGLKAATALRANVNKCNSVFTDLPVSADEICNSNTKIYNALIKNDGSIKRTFRLELDAPAWVKLSENSFSLEPGQEKQAALTASPGSDTKAGEYAISLRALAADEPGINSEDSAEIKTLATPDCYKTSVKSEKDVVSVNYDSSATLPVNINNEGRYKIIYELSLTDTASSFVRLNPSVVEIEAGKSEVVYAYIAPSYDINPGDYNAVVSAKAKDSNILASDSFIVKITGAKEPAKESLWKKTKKFFSYGSDSLTGMFSGISESIKGLAAKENNAQTEPVAQRQPQEQLAQEPVAEEGGITEIGESILNGIDRIEINNTIAEAPEMTGLEESIDLVPVINKIMAQNEEFDIFISNETHKIRLEALTNESAFLSIEPELNYVLLKSGEAKSADINNDGISDIKITLNGIKIGKADLTFEKLGVKKAGVFAEISNMIKSNSLYDYKNYIIIGVIILALLIMIIKTRFYKKLADFFEEDVEEVSEKRDNIKPSG